MYVSEMIIQQTKKWKFGFDLSFFHILSFNGILKLISIELDGKTMFIKDIKSCNNFSLEVRVEVLVY